MTTTTTTTTIARARVWVFYSEGSYACMSPEGQVYYGAFGPETIVHFSDGPPKNSVPGSRPVEVLLNVTVPA